MNTQVVLLQGCIYCALATVGIMIAGLGNPRLMLQDYPASIINAVPPKTAVETRQGNIRRIPFVLILLFYPLLIACYYSAHQHPGFWPIFFFTLKITMIGNVYDLVLLDWLIICAITPAFVVIPGTAGNKGYKDYWFHFKGFSKGTLIMLVLSLIVAGLTLLIT